MVSARTGGGDRGASLGDTQARRGDLGVPAGLPLLRGGSIEGVRRGLGGRERVLAEDTRDFRETGV